MKMLNHKKLAIALAIGGAISTAALTTDISSAATSNANVSVNVSVKQKIKSNSVNWYKGSDSDIIAEGIGKSGGKGMAMARMAAVMDAQRNLLGIIKGVQIDSDTLMQDLIIESDTVKRNISGLLRGAQIIEEQERDNEEYYVKMRVPLYGATDSLASVIMPEIKKNKEVKSFPDVNNSELNESEIQEVKNAGYTGVIINADGLNMVPTFSPVIYDTEGREIYGVENLDYDKVVSEGMVDYADTLEDALKDDRAGDNPLIIEAVEVTGGNNSTNKVNAVISVKDADKILIANEENGILKNTSVVFVK